MQEATYSGSEPERWREQVHLVFSQLDEKQRRLVAWFLSNALGRGGVTRLSRITGLDRKTVRRGRDQLDNGLKDCPTGPILSLGTVGLPTALASCGFATPVDKQPGPPAIYLNILSIGRHTRENCVFGVPIDQPGVKETFLDHFDELRNAETTEEYVSEAGKK